MSKTRIYIYCPCKLKELGLQILKGDTDFIRYCITSCIQNMEYGYKCRHCGGKLIIKKEELILEEAIG